MKNASLFMAGAELLKELAARNEEVKQITREIAQRSIEFLRKLEDLDAIGAEQLLKLKLQASFLSSAILEPGLIRAYAAEAATRGKFPPLEALVKAGAPKEAIDILRLQFAQ